MSLFEDLPAYKINQSGAFESVAVELKFTALAWEVFQRIYANKTVPNKESILIVMMKPSDVI